MKSLASRAVMFFSLLMLMGCGLKPPLRVTTTDGKAVVDVKTLGEYPTTVSRVRLAEAPNGPTIWEVRKKQGTPQIRELTLVLGVNSVALADVDSGEYEVVFPHESSSFMLKKGINYRVEIWGDSDSAGSVKSDFRLAN